MKNYKLILFIVLLTVGLTFFLTRNYYPGTTESSNFVEQELQDVKDSLRAKEIQIQHKDSLISYSERRYAEFDLEIKEMGYQIGRRDSRIRKLKRRYEKPNNITNADITNDSLDRIITNHKFRTFE